MELLPLRRGILRFTGVTLARPDPLGLFRSFVKVPAPQTVLILPKRYPLPPIALPGAMQYQEGGVALAANVGRSEEFVALRDYRRGDPLRHIHWRSWAKAGKPIVKEFEDEFFVRHALVLDTFDRRAAQRSSGGGRFRRRLVCLHGADAGIAARSAVRRQPVLLLHRRTRAWRTRTRCWKFWLRCAPAPTNRLQTLEHLVLNHISAVSGCVCVLQRWDEARQHLVKKLRALGVPLLVLVVVRPGEKKPDAGPLRDEPGTFHVLEIGTIEEELAKTE